MKSRWNTKVGEVYSSFFKWSNNNNEVDPFTKYLMLQGGQIDTLDYVKTPHVQ